MRQDIAGVRQELSKLDYVSRTWFEWTLDGGAWLKTLVIEVAFDTDPNSPDFRDMDELRRVTLNTLSATTMSVHHIRVVPAGASNA